MGTSPRSPKRAEPPPQFSAHLYCGQTAGCIKMPLGMEVGLSPGDLCSMGTQPPPFPKNGEEPPIFCPCLLRPNGCMDQDATWSGGRPQPRRLCARWGHSPLPKKGGTPSPIFGPFLLWPNGWMHQDTTWYGGRPRPRGLCVRWGPRPPPISVPKKGQSPNFRFMSIAAKGLHGSRCHLVRR